MIQVDLKRSFPRKFIAQDADMGEWAQVEPLFSNLLARKPSSPQELEQWLLDYSELSAALSEEEAKRYIAMTSHTDDPVCEAAFQKFVEEITPRCKPLGFAAEKAYLANPHLASLPEKRYAVLKRKSGNLVNLFREKNVALETQDELLAKDYHKIRGAMTVKVDDKELTLQQAAKLLEQPDRALRQQVWEKMAARQLADKEPTEQIYDKLVALRVEMAANAGFPNFRDYSFRRRERFDYGAEDCFRFHDGVERAVLPLARKIRAQRQQLMGLDKLRPWDLGVDPLNRAPLAPFATTAEFVQGTREVFNRVHPALGEQFQFMADQQLLELENRKGKAPGGYQSSLEERRVPFIFMNAVGRDMDLRTLVHEGGHAFHALAAREEPIVDYRHAPIEFCEVASMGMELLALPHLGVFYKNAADFERAYRSRLEDLVLLLPSVALGDAFQHWIYTHPQHTREERAAQWLALANRFNAGVDWTGYEAERAFQWHGILHFFALPFYYIEYGFAQTGALQVWMRSLDNYQEAVQRYWDALTLGGSRPLPELFAAAGARFQFDYESLKPLTDAVEAKLEAKLDQAAV
jgi:oligoendopeptidase F